MSPKMVDLKKAEPVEEYWVHGQKKMVWNIINMLLGHALCLEAVPRLCSKHDVALMVVTGGGVTWMVPPYRSQFWPLTGISKHTNKNLYNAPVRLCWVRN